MTRTGRSKVLLVVGKSSRKRYVSNKNKIDGECNFLCRKWLKLSKNIIAVRVTPTRATIASQFVLNLV